MRKSNNSFYRILSSAIILLSLQLVTSRAYAGGIQDSVAKVWETLGGESVSNGASYYKGQKAGHLSLGSMYFAKQKKNRPLISVNMPEIDFGGSCYNQGVLNLGGLSFISASELKDKIANIGKSAGMMMIYMGISSVSPVISETLQEVYSKLQELGGFLADECQAAKQIVSFIGDKMATHAEKAKSIYSDNHLKKGKDNDLSDAYKKFPKGKKAEMAAAGDKDERNIIEDINLAWKAMEKLKVTDNRLKEKMMTVSGTVIIKAGATDQDQPTFQYISSKVTSTENLEALLKGGANMNLLACGEKSKCLNVLENQEFIKEEESFQHKVEGLFEKIKQALLEDKELDENSINLLAKTGMPSYAIYDLLYQFTGGNPEYEQGVYVEMIAWNLLYNYLSDMLKEVNEAANNLQIGASEQLKEFRDNLRATQTLLSNHEMRDVSRYKLQLFMVNRAENMEEMMAKEMVGLIGMSHQN